MGEVKKVTSEFILLFVSRNAQSVLQLRKHTHTHKCTHPWQVTAHLGGRSFIYNAETGAALNPSSEVNSPIISRLLLSRFTSRHKRRTGARDANVT